MKKKYGIAGIFLSICFSCTVFAEIRPTAKQFPNRTIIIGEYAIVLDALTDELYGFAEASAQESRQEKVYYKSDINAGVWYDITNSTSISQISITKENIVTEQVINMVPLKYYTKITGETVDLKDGGLVQVASLSDKTDPENMEEMKEVMQELEIQKSMLENGGKGENIGDKIKSIERVLRPIADKEEKEEETKEEKEKDKKDSDDIEKRKAITKIKKQLTVIENSILSLKKKGASDEIIAAANKQKTALENERDALCYELIYARLEAETAVLDYDRSSSLLSKYTNAMSNIKASQAVLGVDEKSKEGVKSAEEAMEEEFSKAFGEAIASNEEAAVTEVLENMAILESIQKNTVSAAKEMQQKQVQMLEKLKTAAENTVSETLMAISTDEVYQQAIKNGENAAVIDKLRGELADAVASSLKSLMEIDDKLNDRITDKGKQAENLQKTEDRIHSAKVAAPIELKTYMTEALAPLQEKNKEKLDAVKLSSIPAFSALSEGIEEIQKKIDGIYEAYMTAVEENTLAVAMQLKNQMEVLSQKKENSQNIAKKLEAAVQEGSIAVTAATGEVSAGAGTSGGDGAGNDTGAGTSGGNGTGSSTGAGTSKTKDEKEADTLLQDAWTAVEEGKEAIQVANKAIALAMDQAARGEDESLEVLEKVGTQAESQMPDSRYTAQETAAFMAEIQKMGEEYAVPWMIKFTEYDVKLTSPLYKNGKEIYVPVEELAAQLGITKIMSKTNGAVVLRKSGGILEYIPEDTTVYVNDKKVLIKPAPSKLYQEQIYLPLSCIEKAFGFTETTVDGVIIIRKR